MTVRLLILIASIALILAIGLVKRFRPDLIERLNSCVSVTTNSAIGYWTGIGVAFGAAIGASIDDVGAGVAIGMYFGAAVGTVISKRKSTST